MTTYEAKAAEALKATTKAVDPHLHTAQTQLDLLAIYAGMARALGRVSGILAEHGVPAHQRRQILETQVKGGHADMSPGTTPARAAKRTLRKRK